MKKYYAVSFVLLICMLTFPLLVSATDEEDIVNNLIIPSQQYDTGLSAAYYNNNKQEVEVDERTGQVTLRQTDYSLPGRNGLDLELTRIYRSGQASYYNIYTKRDNTAWINYVESDPSKVDFLSIYEKRYNIGVGMRFSFPTIELKGGYLYLHSESGAVYTLNSKASGYYVVGHNLEDIQVMRSTEYSTGGKTSYFVLIEKDGKKTYFDNNGYVLGIVNRYGDQIQFEYDTYELPIGSRQLIKKITDTVGRVVSFDYHWDSSYNVPASGDLQHKFDTTVTLPDGNMLVYEKSCFVKDGYSQRERLQTVWWTDVEKYADGDYGDAKYDMSYEQARYNFNFNAGENYTTPPYVSGGGAAKDYNVWENIAVVNNEVDNQAKIFQYVDGTRRLGTEGSQTYRRVSRQVDLRLDNAVIDTENGKVSSYTGDVLRETTYSYTGQPDGYIKGKKDYEEYSFDLQDDLYWFRYNTDTDSFKWDGGIGQAGTGGLRSSNYSADTELKTSIKRTFQLETEGELWLDAKLSTNDAGHYLTVYKTQNNQQVELAKFELHDEWGTYGCTIPAGSNDIAVVYSFPAGGRKICYLDNIRIGNTYETTVTDLQDSGHTVRTAKFNGNGLLIEETEVGDQHESVTEYTYDFRNMLSKSEKVFYEKLNGVRQEPGVSTSELYRYDKYGNLNRYSDPGGMNYIYSYDPEKFHKIISTSTSIRADYVLDDLGNTIQETRYPNGIGSEGIVTTFSYDDKGNMIGKNIGGEQNVHYEYGALPDCEEGKLYLTREYSTDADGETVLQDKRYEYDFQTGLLTAESTVNTDGTLNRTSYQYDEFYRITNITYPDMTVKTFTYEPTGLETSDEGRYTIVSNYEHQQIRQCFNADWNVEYISIRDDRASASDKGLVTKYEYDYMGNITAAINPKGETTYYEYDSANRLTSRAYAARYGGQQQEKLNITYGDQECTGTAATNMTITDELGNKTAYWFDKVGQTVKEGVYVETLQGTAGWRLTEYEYDSYHNLSAMTDPNSNRTEYDTDRLGRTTGKTTPDGAVTTYTYTASDQPKTIEEPGGAVTKYFYDQAGRLTRQRSGWKNEIDESYEYQSMEYDLRGNPVSVTLGRSAQEEPDQKTTYGYDSLERLVDQYELIDGTDFLYTQYQYDAFGNQISRKVYGDTADSYFIDTSTYDIYGRVLQQNSEAYWDGVNVGTTKTEYRYDAAGNVLQKRVYTADDTYLTSNYEYDLCGRVTRQEEPSGDGVILTLYTYNAAGNLSQKTKKGAAADGSEDAVTSYTYNARGQVTSVTDALGGVTRYGYDAAGNKIAEVDARYENLTLSTAAGKRYHYDCMNRLYESAVYENGTETVLEQRLYDGRGNLVQLIGGEERAAGSNGRSYTYDYKNRQSSTTPPGSTEAAQTVSYDAAGRKVQENTLQNNGGTYETTTYEYFKNGLLHKLTDPDGALTQYDYDQTGQLVEYQTNALGGQTTVWKTLFGTPWKTQYPDGTTETADYNWYTGLLLLAVDRIGRKKKYRYSATGQLLEVEENYEPTDDESGKYILTRYEYDDWGNKVKEQVVDIGSGTSSLFQETVLQTIYYTYDLLQRQITQVGPGDRETAVFYDAAGNVVKQTQAVTDSYVDVRRWEYDMAGRRTKDIVLMESSQLAETVDAPDDSEYPQRKQLITSYTYDRGGNLKTETDARGNTTIYQYNMDGLLLLQRSGSDNEVTRYTYTPQGDVATVLEPQGQLTGYTYDSCGRLAQKTITAGAISQSWKWDYDLMGNVIEEQTPPMVLANIKMTYTYDNMNRQIAAYNEEGQLLQAVQYDNLDRVVKQSDGRQCNSLEDFATAPGTTYTYDALGRTTSVTDALGGVTGYEYDLLGNVTKQTDALENVTTYEYNEDSTLKKAVLPEGGVITFTYDLKGRLVSETAKRGLLDTVTRQYTYTAQDALAQTTNEDGTVTGVLYDANGNVAQTFDENGNGKTYIYDHANRVVQIDTPVSSGVTMQETYTYNPATGTLTSKSINGTRQTNYAYEYGYLMRESTSAGGVTEYQYDSLGNVSRKQMQRSGGLWDVQNYTYDTYGRLSMETKLLDTAAGTAESKTGYTYDRMGSLVGTTLPGGYVAGADASHYTTTTTYDLLGRVSKITTPYETGGQVQQLETSYTYDAVGRQTGVVDESGNSTTYTYDGRGRVTSMTNALNLVTSYEYDLLGNLVKETTPSGSWEKEYDTRGRVTKVKAPDGAVTAEYTYDGAGNVTQQKNEAGSVTAFTYNQANLLTNTTRPTGGVTSYTYNNFGEKTGVTDGMGNTTSYAYDNAGRLSSVTDALGNTTGYSYDGVGNRTSVTDANGHMRTYTYGTFGLLLSSTDAKGQAQTYSYDVSGQLTSGTDRMGNVFTYTYDNRGRMTGKSAAAVDGETQTISYGYNPQGNRTSMTDSTGVWNYEYDNLYRLTKVSKDGAEQISYGYDNAGNLTSAAYGGGTTSYTYDSRNRMVSAQRGSVGASYTYTNGNLTTTQNYNGTRTDMTYNADGQVTQVTNQDSSGTIVSYYGYTYDAAGRVTQKTDSSGTIGYTYDAAGHLTGVTEPDKTTTYEYDAVGNRKRSVEELIVDTSEADVVEYTKKETSYTYSASNELTGLVEQRYSGTTFVGGTAVQYSYDPNGNQYMTLSAKLSEETAEAELGLVVGAAVGVEMTQAQFDVFGRMTSMTKTKDLETVTATYTYNGDGLRQSRAVTSESDTKTTNYLYDGSYVVQESGSATATYVRGMNYIAKIGASNSVSYYQYNAHGDVTGTTDGIGAAQNRYDYSAFGEEKETEETAENSLRYGGEFYDAELELYYQRARYYEPSTGRFLSEDTYTGEADNPATFNLYAFCNGDPVNYIDPNGHAAKPPAWMDWNDDSIIDTQRDRNYFDKNNDYIADWNQGIGSKADYGINTAQRQVYNGVIANKGIVSQATISGLIEPALSEIAGSPEKVVEWAKIAGVSLAQMNLDVSSLAIRSLMPAVRGGGGIYAKNDISVEISDKVIKQLASRLGINVAEAAKIYTNEMKSGSLSNDSNGVFAALEAEGVELYEAYIYINKIDTTTSVFTEYNIQNVVFQNDTNYAELREMVDILEGAGHVNYDPTSNIATFEILDRNTNTWNTYTFDLNKYNEKSDAERGYILKNDRIMVSLRWLAEKAGLEDTLSWWTENSGKSSFAMLQPDMKFIPVKVTRAGNDVSIKVYRQFSGSQKDAIEPGSNKKYSQLADEGFMEWGENMI